MKIIKNRILDRENGNVKTLMVFSLEVTEGLVLNDLWLKEVNGNQFVSATSKSYKTKDGEVRYMKYVEFSGDIEKKVLTVALDTYRTAKSKLRSVNQMSNEIVDEIDI